MKKINVRPLGEYVLIEPEKQEEKTGSGIYLPETASKEKPQQGMVLAVGEGENIAIKKGERVIYNRYSGTEFTHEGAQYLLVKSEDVIAVIE